MANMIELNEHFAIEKTPHGRFLTNIHSQPHKRLVYIGTHEVSYMKPSWHTGYCNFKIEGSSGTGLIQLRNNFYHYSDITGTKHCDKHCLTLSDVLTIPMEYEDVSVQHIPEQFGVQFPIAIKHGHYDVYTNGHKLQNAHGDKVLVHMQESNAKYIPQIVSIPYKLFPELCFVKNADEYATICPSDAEFKTDIWMYNSDGKVGIVYLDSKGKIESYVIDEIPFSSKDNVYFINENYIIYDFHDIKYLYFRGKYAGKISYFSADTKQEFFVDTDGGFYVGSTFFKQKNFYDLHYLHQTNIRNTPDGKEITLHAACQDYTFIFNPKTFCSAKK